MENNGWQVGFEAFMKKYPDCPLPEPIECLDLIMRKEFAQEIVDGTKTVEFRTYSKHFCNRLLDKAVRKFIDEHPDDEEIVNNIGWYVVPMRQVGKIHFHNYNNTWSLDVSVKTNDIIAVIPEDVKFLQEEFGCHELDDMLEELERDNIEERPLFFFFAIDEILDKNM